MNYVQRLVADLTERLPDCEPQLIDLYALLALVGGPVTSLEDVHDAWAIWCNRVRPEHWSLIPFGELAPSVQELDRPYLQAVHAAATAPDGPWAEGRAA